MPPAHATSRTRRATGRATGRATTRGVSALPVRAQNVAPPERTALPRTDMPVRLHLFGSPTIDLGDGTPPVALPFERRSQLLVLLALKRAWVGRAELAAMLWPDQADKLAFTNLRKTLFRLQDVAWGAPLESQGNALRFAADSDVQAFEQALREQRRADALALHRGPLLAGFDDDANEAWTGWLRFERDRLHAAWRAAALEHLAADTDGAAGLALSSRLLDADPLDEAALRVHMGLLARAGQAARARQAYRAFVERLNDELGLAPGAELQALHDTLGSAAAERSAAAAPRATVAHADAGDAAEQGFVGRTAERRRIAALLERDDVRLLSLTGQGGIGKTRLAERALHDLSPAFADGGCFVRLEDVGDAGELVARIARGTATALRGRSATIEQLCNALRERQMLVVLDNVEQLVEVAPTVLDPLLAACPRLKLLTTSRVRLGLAAEHVLPLEGLPCPEREDADRIEAFDAPRLFVAAARRVEPALLPSAEATAIVDICRQVEGLPLALELAAAWTRVLSCEAIAAELREGIELLRASDATHPARHASIELVFEQSWRRLAPAEREALASLSVFQGGFSAEAARAVAGTPLPVLGSLADKSLLRKDGARLSLHPLVQQLAAARLDPAARNEARQAHAEYFRHMLAQRWADIQSGDRATLLAVDVELENCRLAWQWLIVQGDGDAVRQCGRALQFHFDHRGRFEEGLALMRQALGAPTLRDDVMLQTWLLSEAAQLEYRLDRYAQASAMAREILATKVPAHERRVVQRAHNILGACALRQGQYPDARRHFRQALDMATSSGDAANLAATLDHLALAEKHLGHYDEALRLSLESLAQHRRIGDSASVALCLCNLGSLYMAREELDTALPFLHEALAICDRDGLTGTLPFVLGNLSELTIDRGDVDAAQAYAERAAEVSRASGNRSIGAWMTLQLARLAQRRGEYAAARDLLADGTKEGVALGMPFAHGIALLAFAELLRALGDAAAADRVLGFAVDQPSIGDATRSSLVTERRRWGLPDRSALRWPGLGLDELLQRIVTEAPLQHAPLRALLNTEPLGAAPAA